METLIEALFGTLYVRGAYSPIPFVIVYLEGGEVGNTTVHFG